MCGLSVTRLALTVVVVASVNTQEMSKKNSTGANKTVTNDVITGVVDNVSIPVQIHDGYASYDDVTPIHSCDGATIKERSSTTHHYVDIFTDNVLAPLGDLVYVRIDAVTAEKVFVNRNKKILIWSSDGVLAQWRCAPTFESNNRFIAGTPIVNQDGALVSVVTAKKGNNYAISSFEGEGGYFYTTEKWKVLETADSKTIYGDKAFDSRDAVLEYVKSLPPLECKNDSKPIIHVTKVPRVCLVAPNGCQISHTYLPSAITGAEYL